MPIPLVVLFYKKLSADYADYADDKNKINIRKNKIKIKIKIRLIPSRVINRI